MNILYGKNENNVEFEKELLNFSKDVLSLGNLVQIDLRLSATFNYFWWLFFYSNKESGSNSTEKYFEIINSALAQGYYYNDTLFNLLKYDLLNNIQNKKFF